jgi:hypothetical protein
MNWLRNREEICLGAAKECRQALTLCFLLGAALILSAPRTWAQGCIVARSTQQVINPLSGTSEQGVLRPENQGGYLAPHQWELTLGYRHQFSERHFVGPTEQIRREQEHSRVMNKINLPSLQLTYQMTPRWSFSAGLPILFATRRGESSPSTFSAQGFGDTVVTAQTWIWSPEKPHSGNVSVGFGILFPTGRSNIQNTLEQADGTEQTRPVDYSIQPGQGGWGIVGQFQAFHLVGSKGVTYLDGSYIATPQNQNHTCREGRSPLTACNSISDQYVAEGGYAYPLSFFKGLVLTIGPRIEGVPVRDIFGQSFGFRRPGFAISIEPGFIIARGKSMYTFNLGKAVYRTRERSVPDIVTGGHGDAAFADYVWLGSYTYRF